MDIWERFDETTLPDKKLFIVNCIQKTLLEKTMHAQKVFEDFNLNNLDDYHDLYVQSDILFENFRNKCIEIYELDPAHFLSAPELA